MNKSCSLTVSPENNKKIELESHPVKGQQN